MDYFMAQEKEIITNKAVIVEEEQGMAAELTPEKPIVLSDSVRSEIRQLSAVEVIT